MPQRSTVLGSKIHRGRKKLHLKSFLNPKFLLGALVLLNYWAEVGDEKQQISFTTSRNELTVTQELFGRCGEQTLLSPALSLPVASCVDQGKLFQMKRVEGFW